MVVVSVPIHVYSLFAWETVMGGKRGPKKKIVRVSEEYELDDIGTELKRMWEGERKEDRATLTELRDYFNKEVFRAAMRDAGMDVVPGEVDHGYKHLFGDDGKYAEAEDFRNRLERNGVDVDSVLDKCINSPQTIHNYLIEDMGVSLRSDADDRSRNEKTLQHLRSLDRRYEDIVSDVIERLQADGEYPDGDVDVSVDCYVTNFETGRSQHIRDILEE